MSQPNVRTTFNLRECPGYLDAVKHENDLRDAAMLNLNTRICGIEVRQMTLRHWLILNGIQSPFINGSLPDPDSREIEKFLWVLSPKFTPVRFSFAKAWLSYRVSKLKYGEAVIACRKFVDDTFQDEPPSVGEEKNGGYNPPLFSFSASLIISMCSNTPWTRETIHDMPLKETFQYIKIFDMRAHAARGEKYTGFNPSDVLKWAYIRQKREEEKQSEAQ